MEFCGLKVQRATESDHVLDAVICTLGGLDYLNGDVISPDDLDLAPREGWVWVRNRQSKSEQICVMRVSECRVSPVYRDHDREVEKLGSAGTAICRECGHDFSVTVGGGFEFQIFFCEDCGYGNSLIHGQKMIPDLPDDPGCVGGCERCSGRLTRTALPRCSRCRSTDLAMELDVCVD